MYENCTIGNVYLCKDGRLRIYIVFPDGHNTVISYPKYLMEIRLGRNLDKDETVDHIDGNPLNNHIENLQVLKRSDHVILDVKRLKPQEFICPECGQSFELSGRKLHDAKHNRLKRKAGPFCSKSCSGKYGRKIQLKRVDLLPVIPIRDPEYITNKLSMSLYEETHRVDNTNSGNSQH